MVQEVQGIWNRGTRSSKKNLIKNKKSIQSIEQNETNHITKKYIVKRTETYTENENYIINSHQENEQTIRKRTRSETLNFSDTEVYLSESEVYQSDTENSRYLNAAEELTLSNIE